MLLPKVKIKTTPAHGCPAALVLFVILQRKVRFQSYPYSVVWRILPYTTPNCKSQKARTAMQTHCGSFLSLSVFYSVFWAVSRSWSISSSSDGWCAMRGLPWAVQPVRRYGQ